jgi:flagellar basal body rod protein FlgC
MQWLQDPNDNNIDNLNNVRSAASRHFRNKEKEYLEVKIDKLKTNSKIKNIRDLYRDISNFKKGYHPRANIVKNEKGDLVTGFHSISVRW